MVVEEARDGLQQCQNIQGNENMEHSLSGTGGAGTGRAPGTGGGGARSLVGDARGRSAKQSASRFESQLLRFTHLAELEERGVQAQCVVVAEA